MIDRRDFLRRSAVVGTSFLAGGPASVRQPSALTTATDFDKSAAARELAAHQIVAITARRVRDRYPRSVGPNSRGRPVGRGGSYRVRTITTDKGASGWAMCHLSDEALSAMELQDVAHADAGLAGSMHKCVSLPGSLRDCIEVRLPDYCCENVILGGS